MKVRELIKKLADRNMDAEVMVSTGDTYDDVSDFCLSWGGPHSTDSEKDHRDEEFVYINFFEDNRENAALPDVPVGERIRDSIALVLTDVDEQVLRNRALTLKAALEWLEKQGEQEKKKIEFKASDWYVSKVDGKIHNIYQQVDEAEPKFKVGDWITATDEEGNVTTEKIIEFWGDKVRLIDINGFYSLWPKHELNYYHLWSINDARDGDVLAYVTDEEDLWIMIYRSLYEPYEGHVHYHALLVNDNFSDKGTCCICIDNLIPATKEQRDLLFSKMRESGYEWDAGKKELKKIEVSSKENEDNRIRKGIIRNLQYLMDRSEGFVKEDLRERIAWLEKQGKNVQPDMPEDGQILNSLTDVDKRALLDRPVTLRAAIDWLSKQCKQECSVCSKILNNGETMNEKDIEELKKWLCDRGYYMGNSNVAKSLRKLADEFDD